VTVLDKNDETQTINRSGSLTLAGILGDIDLGAVPFSGEPTSFFDEATLRRAALLVRANLVKIGAINLQGSVAAISGLVRSSKTDPLEDVAVLIQRPLPNHWVIDGKIGAIKAEPRCPRVAALLIAAMIEKGALPAFAEEGIDGLPTMHIFCQDVRNGILHWDETELRAVLENLCLIRLENPTEEILRKLKGMGIKQVAAIYPCDEIVPECLDCFAYTGVRRSTQELFWADFLANRKMEIEALGCEIIVDPELGITVVEPSEWYGEIESDDAPEMPTDWFSFECGIEIDGVRINIIPTIIKYLESKPVGFTLTEFEKIPEDSKIPLQHDEGMFLAVPAKKLQAILGLLTELFDEAPLTFDNKIKMHPVRAAHLATMKGEEKLVSKIPPKLTKLAEDFELLKPRVEPDAPKGFQATLRPYQEDGFEWLQFLREQGVGGILADDMGLGKTMQTLRHLYCEKEAGRANLPSLILAPKSVVPGWAKEAKKFAPSLTVLTLQGPDRKKYFPMMAYSDLVVTSYPVLLRDAEELLLQAFHFVVLDEAHTIKNSRSQITKVANRIDARHRLCLSGTPIENHLGELWSQFHFLMPGFLGSEESFTRCFRIPIEKFRDESRRQRLAQRVAPLMLRRTKALVATDLPPKTEIIKKVELSDQQIEIYEAVRASLQKEVREEISRHGVEASQLLVLEALMKLRQVCCHPRLVLLPTAQKAETCDKFEMMMEWLPDMVREGRRILIFSQFTRMLAIMEQRLDEMGQKYQTLTGQSKDRGGMVDRFQTGKIPIFLISLRAGGTGITLTKADTVIHYDPWWNPALESQATDRAYRIGQQNPVFVYKLISEGTIEDKILMLQEKKRALYEGIFEGTPQKLSFSEQELDNLLAPIVRN
jgi:superfamily II DNA or RNA helicase